MIAEELQDGRWLLTVANREVGVMGDRAAAEAMAIKFAAAPERRRQTPPGQHVGIVAPTSAM